MNECDRPTVDTYFRLKRERNFGNLTSVIKYLQGRERNCAKPRTNSGLTQ